MNIGINNRNLKTMEVNIFNSLELAQIIPDGITKVSESGIKNGHDADLIYSSGYDAILVGESLINSDNPKLKIKKLIEGKE